MSYYVLACFAVTLALAIGVGYVFTLSGISVVEQPDNPANAIYFFGYIVVSAIVLLLVLKYYHGTRLFTLLELLINFTSVQLIAVLFLNEWESMVAGLLAVVLRLAIPASRNLWLLLTTAVIGALLGSSLGIIPAVALAILLSAYDYYAVFISKHMVTMAEQLQQRKAAFALAVRHQQESLHLGTGDLVVPSMMAVSALKIAPHPLGLAAAVSVAFGCFVGLAVLLYAMEIRRGYWPALPPIVGMGLVALVTFVFL